MNEIERAYLAGLLDGYEDERQRVMDLANYELEMSSPDGVVDTPYYSKFEIWRETHKVHRDPGGVTPRCPRCYSTKVRISDPYIKCLSCRYSEFLWE